MMFVHPDTLLGKVFGWVKESSTWGVQKTNLLFSVTGDSATLGCRDDDSPLESVWNNYNGLGQVCLLCFFVVFHMPSILQIQSDRKVSWFDAILLSKKCSVRSCFSTWCTRSTWRGAVSKTNAFEADAREGITWALSIQNHDKSMATN